MRKGTLMTLVLVSTLLGSSLTLAAPNNGHQNKANNGYQNKANNGHQNKAKAKAHPSHYWKRGDKVPSGYYNDKRYWVSDWKARHLSPPPQGHRWLEVDGRYVLAAVAGGAITAIILSQ